MNSRLYHASWGGMFAHPLLDRDIFASLPYIRQREILASMYGGSVPDVVSIPSLPLWFKFYIPDSISLPCLLRHRVDSEKRGIVEPNLDEVVATLQKHVTMENLLLHCTARGRGDVFRGAKPYDGIYAYLWRVARFQEGTSTAVSLEALWDLEDGVQTLTGVYLNFLQQGRPQKVITDWLNSWAVMLAGRVGGDPQIGTLRYGRAMGLAL